MNLIKTIILTLLCLSLTYLSIAQKTEDGLFLPKVMVEMNHSDKYMFTSGHAVSYNKHNIDASLNYEYGLDMMSCFGKEITSKRNVIYFGAGLYYTDYKIKSEVHNNTTMSGHFPMAYSYSPNPLDYNLTCTRIQLHLNHYAFFKRIILFQKLGLSYSIFIKKNTSESEYVEKYGNSFPTKDPAFVTPDNPEGWHFVDNYTYTTHQDMDIYKNGLSAFYKFGLGYRIKKFTPFINVEFSDVLGNFKCTYLKGQIGLNYSFIKQ